MKTIEDDLRKSLEDLKKLERKEFKPEEEADVQCMLYYLLRQNGVKATDILNHHPIDTRNGKRFVDILLGKEGNSKVLVEIKLVWCGKDGKAQRFSQQTRALFEDIEKLREIKRQKKYKAKLVGILYVDLRQKKSRRYFDKIEERKRECKNYAEFWHNYDSPLRIDTEVKDLKKRKGNAIKTAILTA